jgi:hypothetical protein
MGGTGTKPATSGQTRQGGSSDLRSVRHLALRCDVSPDGSRIILAPVLWRDAPVAVVAWDIHVGLSSKQTKPAAEIWNAAHHLGPQADELHAPPTPFFALLSFSEDEATFITSVCEQLALGLENLRLRLGV